MSILLGDVTSPSENPHYLYVYFENIVKRFENHEKVALYCGTEVICYKELEYMICSIEHWLIKKMKRAGTSLENYPHRASDFTVGCTNSWMSYTALVGVCVNRSPELVALLLAIWKINFAFVPFDVSLPVIRTENQFKVLNFELIIGDCHTVECFRSFIMQSSALGKKYEHRIFNIEDWKREFCQSAIESLQSRLSRLPKLQEHRSSLSTENNNLACVLCTSGSSGKPKQVPIFASNLNNRFKWQWKTFPYSEGDVAIMSKPLTFIDSITEIFIPLLSVVPVVIVRETGFNPEALLKYVFQYNVTHVVLTPSTLKIVLLYVQSSLEATQQMQRIVKYWFVSGEPLPHYLVKEFCSLFKTGHMVNLYGSTETTGDVTYHVINRTLMNEVAIGHPIVNSGVILTKEENEQLTCVEENECGEILVVGKNIFPSQSNESSNESVFVTVRSVKFLKESDTIRLVNFLKKIDGTETEYNEEKENIASPPKEIFEISDETKSDEVIPNKKFESTIISKLWQLSGFEKLTLRTRTAALNQQPKGIISFLQRQLYENTGKEEVDRPKSEEPNEAMTKPEYAETADVSNILNAKNWLAYRTGDFGRIRAGQLYFEGRKDDQVKIRGTRIHLEEVEVAVKRTGVVESLAILLTPSGRRTCSSNSSSEDDLSSEEDLAVFVVLVKEYEGSEREATIRLLQDLKHFLGDVAAAPKVVVMDALPLTTNGKVDRQLLLKKYEVQRRRPSQCWAGGQVVFLKKDEPLEIQVQKVICSSLGMERSQDALKKNYFAMGGTSLSSLMVVSRLKALGCDVTLENFLRAPSIGELVHGILKAKTMSEVMSLFSTTSGAPQAVDEPVAILEAEEDKDEDQTFFRDDPETQQKATFRYRSGSAISLHPDLPSVVMETSGGSGNPSSSLLHTPGLTRGVKINNLVTLPLSQLTDSACIVDILSSSYASKNPLHTSIGVSSPAIADFLSRMWPYVAKDELSFVVKDPYRGILGVAINVDFLQHSQPEASKELHPITAVHHHLEANAKEKLGSVDKWMYNKMMATHEALGPQDNVRLCLHMEKEIIRIAKKKRFFGVLTINSNRVNQVLCCKYLGYEKCCSLQLQDFSSDGKELPFSGMTSEEELVLAVKTF